MQEKALVYGIVAWLACWLVDLIIIVARGPVLIDPILKLIIVLLCLAVILLGLARNGWLVSA
jgi:hypothetical protein